VVKAKWVARTGLALAMAALVVPGPAQAQFSRGYKFLEAVRKKDGGEVTNVLNEPGSTVINTRDATTGDTALHIVTGRRDLTWMSFLIGKGANVNARNDHGVTPLEVASSLGFQEGVQLLLDEHARVDEVNATGETALVAAVHNRDTGMMRILLRAGADPDRPDNSGRSARDYALLDGRNSSLVSEIQNNAKPREQRAGAHASYGPSF